MPLYLKKLRHTEEKKTALKLINFENFALIVLCQNIRDQYVGSVWARVRGIPRRNLKPISYL